MTDFTLEVPIDSLEVASAAAPMLSPRDRFELCDDLASEGWTPKMELVRAVRAEAPAGVGIVAMIRPRGAGAPSSLDVAGFTATPTVVEASIREIEDAAEAGADSVAVGLLTASGAVDLDACGRLVETARGCGLEVAFLRTFDLLVDRDAGLRAVHDLGCVRVVTAGVLGWDASVAGLPARLETLSADVARASKLATDARRPAVEIVPGGGVRASNAASFAAVSPHLHASCRRDGVFSPEELGALTSLRRS
ncbi:MAG: copper homeostasis protein CutC [Planctomycetota bacterium]